MNSLKKLWHMFLFQATYMALLQKQLIRLGLIRLIKYKLGFIMPASHQNSFLIFCLYTIFYFFNIFILRGIKTCILLIQLGNVACEFMLKQFGKMKVYISLESYSCHCILKIYDLRVLMVYYVHLHLKTFLHL